LTCNYVVRREGGIRVAIIDCENCENSSSLLDKNCRRNIFQILLKEADIGKLILNHPLVKIFYGKSFDLLKSITNFLERLHSININDFLGNDERCKSCNERKIKKFNEIINISFENPIEAFKKLKREYETNRKKPIILSCSECRKKYLKTLLDVIETLDNKIKEKDSSFYYMYEMQPYVRPIFFDTYIYLAPPPDAVFIKKYEIKSKGRPVEVSLYLLSTRPEKLYFIIPPEYNLSLKELKILQKVREKLSKHRPKDSSFMEPETSREYFLKFAKETIKKIAEEENYSIDIEKLDMLSDIFAKYTAGLGILEDLLLDKNIQDIYINAPVANNPLHIVWRGEEFTSNIYLSEQDVEALSSKLRSLSGRPFSEASPILDMGIEKYGYRIAAISNPLTPKGVAFAIRRHSITPWTLPKFISYNMLSPLAAGLLSFFVDGQATILIAGSRGAGKTSLLSSLILEIPQRYRILTLEDTPELPIDYLQKLGYKIQSLITQPITAIESSGVDPKTALRTALRLGESVLILGEVRGEETKVLFEAMRVGAAGNVVLGTIHGATTRDVFERIVYDIGVPATSFKATDIIVIASPIRIGGGIERKRRVVQISEVVKSGWGKDADPDKIFADIMIYNPEKDELESTDLLEMGQSEVIGKIAREWGISIENALENIYLRAKIKEEIANYGKINKNVLEAKAVRDANNAFWMLIEESKKEYGKPNYKEIEIKWIKWFKKYARSI